MNESLHRTADQPEPAEHAIGEMELAPKTSAGARARALMGVTMAMSAFAAITPALSDTTVSVQ
ncbi:hypothetical protein [Lentzea flaviverrucosa]|uniref:Uncharacterized protein n=1 Tax=Lentzea flaviverrucosa TaxID=200379 RepID=A0A1H9W7G1_9PSEU|nr:hypothetical protein [Lentzea flaviverrucosa]RDI22325.1 hypothetical protein DFR72_112193 [Lentzea flaviverrucosa]SES29838.1 hypothetical protein SAMN05216195_111113 [Lentzea flaviverrucosa]